MKNCTKLIFAFVLICFGLSLVQAGFGIFPSVHLDFFSRFRSSPGIFKVTLK